MLGFIGDYDEKYADLLSVVEPITMMVRLTGGFNASIMTPVLIFKKLSRSYPISGLEDSVPGVPYRTSTHAWMDPTVWREWLCETSDISGLAGNRQRVL